MTIETKAYGLQEIEEKQIFCFPNGIVAFEKLDRWALVAAKQPPFFILQSLDDVAAAFFLLDPTLFRPDYSVTEAKSDLERLHLTELLEDGVVFGIVNIPNGDPANMTINLQAPIVLNIKERLGAQCILEDARWELRYKIARKLADREG